MRAGHFISRRNLEFCCACSGLFAGKLRSHRGDAVKLWERSLPAKRPVSALQIAQAGSWLEL
ncbi:hypothetical protein C3F00_022365 [Pseudomonas sp. MWU13-2860]|nr:hypothetical protein C3F00_022365 [Pseudomonas sp. MWU13-2860]